MYDSHIHTPLCNHALHWPTECAAAAFERGLKGIIITCHSPADEFFLPDIRMEAEEFEIYTASVDKARAEWQGRVDVRLGIECDFLPGKESYVESVIAKAEFDFVLGSVHPWLPEYEARYYSNYPLSYQRTYFEILATAAESGFFHALAHPDIIKTCVPDIWDPYELLDEICRALDRIAKTGVALELNTSGVYKSYPEMNPGLIILQEMHERGIPVVVGSDAHEAQRVGDLFPEALSCLRDADYKEIQYYLAGQPQRLTLDEAAASLGQLKSVVNDRKFSL